MQMSTLKGWRGELPEEAPKEELKHLTPKGTVESYYLHLQNISGIFPNNMLNQRESVAQQNYKVPARHCLL